MESRAPAVVAVVVTTGAGPGLEVTLASLVAQDYGELSLLVIANGEYSDVATRVAQVAPSAFVRSLDDNRGFGPACNEAGTSVEGSVFLLLCHDDVRLDPDAVQQLVEVAFRTNAGIVTPKVVAYDDPLVLLHVGQTCDRFGVVQERVDPGEIDHGQQDLERDVFVAPGGVTLVRTDLFTTLRGFDPMIPALGEDLDLCWRAQMAGARVVVAPSARVAHRETIATGERPISALRTRKSSRQDLQRRHQLLVVATGWSLPNTIATLSLLLVMDLMEFILALLGADTDRAGAILGSWQWLLHNYRHAFDRRRQRRAILVLSDHDLRRLQVGGAQRLKRFFFTLLRHGLDRARGIIPVDTDEDLEERSDAGVGFGAVFTESDEFDEIPLNSSRELRHRPSRFLAGFRSQALALAVIIVLWFIGSRNMVATHLPLVGRLAPLDSWAVTWRHFFATWSSNGVGTVTPGMPGYGLLGLAGTFVGGRMGILPRLVLLGAAPLGAFGVARLLHGKVSNRARIVSAFSYLAAPLALNLVGQGRIDVLIVVAGLPFLARRIFEHLAVPSFRDNDYPEAVPFGRQGWRVTQSGQWMMTVMIMATMGALAPATLVVVALLVAGVVIARFFEPDRDSPKGRPWRFFAAITIGGAIFLAPLTLDVVFSGTRALEVFGLSRGPWSAPSFFQLLRGVDGHFGSGWSGYLLPAAAMFGFVLCQGVRRAVASKVFAVAIITVILETFSVRNLLGPFAPDLDVLITLYTLMLVILVGLGISAIELDVRASGFGWRQLATILTVGTLAVTTVPFFASLSSGRFDLPTTSVAESLSALAPTTTGGYRVLWLGDPSVLPAAGWSIAPGLAAVTSMNGLPGGSDLFVAPNPGTSDVLLASVKLALEGRTVRLGQLLAPAGISTIVVMNTSAPELSGVQSAPLRPVPEGLSTALGRQTDLALELSTSAVEVFGNSLFHGILAQANPTTSAQSGLSPVLNGTFSSGALAGGQPVLSGFAPSDAFTLKVNGRSLPRQASAGWASSYLVPESATPLQGQLVLHRFPFNGILALLTLLLWSVVWLGFGWVQRLEWIFTWRMRRATKSARHVRKSDDG